MTATRWWVRLAARWLARIDGVSGQLRLAMLVLTGVSTATLTLQSYGYGEWAWPFIVVLGTTTIVYTFLYAEGGVWNQVARDRVDLSTNYAGPTMRMDDELIGLAVFAAIHRREPTPEERRAISNTLDNGWNDYRDGLSDEYFNDDS